MKAVFDSNIFVSALGIPGGQAQRAVELAIDGRVQLYISREIIQEILEVLAHKFARNAEELARTALFLADCAQLVKPHRKLAVLADEPDNRILECAVTGDANVIVTGDRGMLSLKMHEGIRILSLRHFLDEMDEPE